MQPYERDRGRPTTPVDDVGDAEVDDADDGATETEMERSRPAEEAEIDAWFATADDIVNGNRDSRLDYFRMIGLLIILAVLSAD